MKKSLSIFLVFILLATSLVVFSGTSNAFTPTYVAITLTNSQTTATVKDFSQLIKVNWSAYASDLNANVSNVRFYNSTTFSSSNELAGWIEDNNTTTATSSNIWVNLSGTIVPASGSVIIYMEFLPTTASWSSHWGLAPQLSTTYGQFDNGANVFQFYCDFKGTTLNSEWTVSGITYTVNNGFSATATGVEGYIISKKLPLNPATDIVDFYGNNFQGDTSNWVTTGMLDGSETTSTSGSGLGTGISAGAISGSSTYTTGYQRNSSTASISAVMQSTSGNAVWTVDPTTSTTSNYYINYSGVQTLSTDADTYPLYEGLISAGANAASYTFVNPITYDWYRVRLAPPGNVMPSTSFGPTLTNIYSISFSQTSLPSGTKWGIRLNNTIATIWQNSTSEYDNLSSLANGTYTYQVINATGYQTSPPASYTGTLTINGANLSQTIVFIGYKISFSESGLPSGLKWYVNLSDQPGLSESSTGQKLSSTTAYNNASLPNGSYSYTLTTVFDGVVSYAPTKLSGSFTVSGSSLSIPVLYSPVNYYVNFTALHKPANLKWSVNLSGVIESSATSSISYKVVNGTYSFNVTSSTSKYWSLQNNSGKITVNGSAILSNVTFTELYIVTFSETGLPTKTTWNITLYNSTIVQDLSSTTIYNNDTPLLPNGTYDYNILDPKVGNVEYSTYPLSGSFVINGSNVLASIKFVEINTQHPIYVPITLSNYQSSYVNSQTDIITKLDWFQYSTYLYYNVSNVRFFSSLIFTPNNELYAWMEDNNTPLYSSSNVWINIGSNTIPPVHANGLPGTYTIYMLIDPTFTWGNHWGEAPQLTTPYAKHDNGENVFAIYYNFVGKESIRTNSTTAPTPINKYFSLIDGAGLFGYANETGNGLTFSDGLGDNTDTYPAIVSTNTYNFSLLSMDFYANIKTYAPDPSTAGSDVQIGTSLDNGNGGGVNYSAIMTEAGYSGQYLETNSGSTSLLGYSPALYSITEVNGKTYATINMDKTVSETSINQYNDYIHLGGYWTSSASSGATSNFSIHLDYIDLRYTPPNGVLPDFSIGSYVSLTTHFEEYGLPNGVNWAVETGYGNSITLSSSNTPKIYSLFTTGEYQFSVGSIVNGTFHAGIVGKYVPSPETGTLTILIGTPTTQTIFFNPDRVLKYNIIPETATGKAGNITMPLFIQNTQGLPANQTVISEFLKNLTATFLAKGQNNGVDISWTYSSSGYGQLVIFMNITKAEIVTILNKSALISFVAPFYVGTIEDLSIGVAGYSVFSNFNSSGVAITNTTPPVSALWASLGFNSNPPNNPTQIVAWIIDNSGGRALTVLVGLATLIYFALALSRQKKIAIQTNARIERDKKMDKKINDIWMNNGGGKR